MHRATKESRLTKSANGSIARRAQKAVTLGHTEAATSALDKMCLLMEVRLYGVLGSSPTQ